MQQCRDENDRQEKRTVQETRAWLLGEVVFPFLAGSVGGGGGGGEGGPGSAKGWITCVDGGPWILRQAMPRVARRGDSWEGTEEW